MNGQWCCENGQRLGVTACPDCIATCAAYQEAMGPEEPKGVREMNSKEVTGAGVWKVLPDFSPPIITEAVGDKAIRYWQDLACANRKVAEDAQSQRDKAVAFLERYFKEVPIGNHPYMMAQAVHIFLKECGK